MKTSIHKIFFLSILIAFFYSCSENEALVEEENLVSKKIMMEVEKQSPQHQALFEYARLLSIAIDTHENLNEILQEKALKLERLGYYEQEFYVGMEEKNSMKEFGNNSLHSVLEKVGNTETPSLLKEFTRINPAMTVLLLGDAKAQGFSNRIYVDNGFDDSNPKETIYFYENGILKSQQLDEKPLLKSFIVRNSEVYVNVDDTMSKANNDEGVVLFSYADGRTVKVNSGAIIDLSNNAKLLSPDDIDGGGGGGGGTPPTNPCTQTCERDCFNLTENLWRFRTHDDYDSFFRGKGEWFFVIIWADDVSYSIQNGTVVVTGPPLSYLKTGTINGVEGNFSWHYPNFSSIMWDRVVSPTNPIADGNRMKIACFESDGGGSKTFPLGNFSYNIQTELFGTFNFAFPLSFTINNDDDFIGEYIVEYCQGIGSDGFIYHPSSQVDVQHNER